MSAIAPRVPSLLRCESARDWQSARRTSLPTLSLLTQSRGLRSSQSKAAFNQFNQYITPQERADQRRAEQANSQARAMDKNFTREWKSGDVYAPHDLSAAEARKWRKRYTPTVDAFDALSLNPLDFYKNFAVMSEYMTEMGRIRHSNLTGLRQVNQRKIAKALRRAIGLGLMPAVHRHPEILKIHFKRTGEGGYS